MVSLSNVNEICLQEYDFAGWFHTTISQRVMSILRSFAQNMMCQKYTHDHTNFMYLLLVSSTAFCFFLLFETKIGHEDGEGSVEVKGEVEDGTLNESPVPPSVSSKRSQSGKLQFEVSLRCILDKQVQ